MRSSPTPLLSAIRHAAESNAWRDEFVAERTDVYISVAPRPTELSRNATTVCAPCRLWGRRDVCVRYRVNGAVLMFVASHHAVPQ
jgi:hypothetical protein